ncbi:hypothetical protein WJX72_011972 [[Myrmecia] bisecta]|uniref:Fatty acid hydroxylase domain-containing protein n=1 Tax=[Myrmecia] bisecta TaxID=41462 RepID=A0AAW1PUK3_9CHLO
MKGALCVFFGHPTPVLIVASLFATAAWRSSCGALTLADAAVVGTVAAWWMLQEWLVHSQLLHSDIDWFGRQVHDSHHHQPYFHVSIDGPGLVRLASNDS